MNTAAKQKFLNFVSWMFLFLWAALIFILSAQPAVKSDDLSKGITKAIIETIDSWVSLGLETSTTDDLVSQINHLVRKLAHGGSYFIMGILSVNAFRRISRIGNKGYAFSSAFCILFAISDEVHQLYVPGRSGEVRDVLIDSTGAILAVLLLWGISAIKQRGVSMKEFVKKNIKVIIALVIAVPVITVGVFWIGSLNDDSAVADEMPDGNSAAIKDAEPNETPVQNESENPSAEEPVSKPDSVSDAAPGETSEVKPDSADKSTATAKPTSTPTPLPTAVPGATPTPSQTPPDLSQILMPAQIIQGITDGLKEKDQADGEAEALLLNNLTEEDIALLQSLVSDGLTEEEKEIAKELAYKRFTPEELEIVMKLYEKYTNIFGE